MTALDFLTESGRNQNRVVNRRAKLYAADNGRRDERHLRTKEVRACLIDENRQLNGRNQHHRNRNRLEGQGDNQENR